MGVDLFNVTATGRTCAMRDVGCTGNFSLVQRTAILLTGSAFTIDVAR